MKYDRKLQEILQTGIWLEEQERRRSGYYFEEYRKRHGFSRVTDSDRSIHVSMYGDEPTGAALQKIRFWRLGQHLPQSREEALLLGRALELDSEETDLFLKEHCLLQGLKKELDQAEIFSGLFMEFLSQVTDDRLLLLDIPPGTQQQRRCHIFYSEALDCIHLDGKTRLICYRQHLYSRGFASEFRKYFQANAVLSRGTVVRLLILLLMPDLNRQVINDYLTGLGYAALNPGRQQEGYVDYIVCQLLELCISTQTGDRVKDRNRMKHLLCRYDTLVTDIIRDPGQQRNFRIMKFRSLGNETAERHIHT